jgi:prepilin-type processing-associated H-X9-DG protein
LYPAVRAARIAAWRTQRSNNLKQVGLAFHNFHDIYRRCPAAVRRDELGRPLSSWRFQLSMYAEAWMLDVSFGDRWDDPQNRWLTGYPHPLYCLHPDRDPPENLHTNVVGITGPGTIFDEGREYRFGQFDSDTIVAIEVAEFDVCWAEPGDLHIDDVNESVLAGPDGGGLHVLFADGSVWFIPSTVPLEGLKKFFTIEGARAHDREQVLAPYQGGR